MIVQFPNTVNSAYLHNPFVRANYSIIRSIQLTEIAILQLMTMIQNDFCQNFMKNKPLVEVGMHDVSVSNHEVNLKTRRKKLQPWG